MFRVCLNWSGFLGVLFRPTLPLVSFKNLRSWHLQSALLWCLSVGYQASESSFLHRLSPEKFSSVGRTVCTYPHTATCGVDFSNAPVWVVAVLIAVAVRVFPIDFSGQKAAVRLIFA